MPWLRRSWVGRSWWEKLCMLNLWDLLTSSAANSCTRRYKGSRFLRIKTYYSHLARECRRMALYRATERFTTTRVRNKKLLKKTRTPRLIRDRDGWRPLAWRNPSWQTSLRLATQAAFLIRWQLSLTGQTRKSNFRPSMSVLKRYCSHRKTHQWAMLSTLTSTYDQWRRWHFRCSTWTATRKFVRQICSALWNCTRTIPTSSRCSSTTWKTSSRISRKGTPKFVWTTRWWIDLTRMCQR